LATTEHLQQQIRRVSARLGDTAAEANYFRAYGRTMQQSIASWQRQKAALQAVRLTPDAMIPTHRVSRPASLPQQVAVSRPGGLPSLPQQVAHDDPGGMLAGIGGIFDATGDILGTIPRAASAVGGAVSQVLPVVLRFAPVIAVVALLYAISAVFRIRVKVG